MTRTRWLQLLAYLVLASVVIFTSARTFDIASGNKVALEQIKKEGEQRRDQICLGAERTYNSEVTTLKSTYRYLEELKPREVSSSINVAVLRGLPQTEDTVKTGAAPAFCDETNSDGSPVGLPEPNPTVPKRPAKVDHMYKALLSRGK